MATPILPRAQSALVDHAAMPVREWYDFFRDLLGRVKEDEDLIAEIEAILARLETLESAQILGQNSVVSFGSLSSGLVTLMLQGDVAAPGQLFYYGTGPTGSKGFWPAASLVAYLVDENGDYLVDENGNFLIGQDITDDLFAIVNASGTTAQFWRGDKAFTNDLLGPTIAYAFQFTKQSSNPAAIPTQALYQDDGTNYQDGTLVWNPPAALESTLLVGSKGNEQDAIRINNVQVPVRIKSSKFGGTATILCHEHSTTTYPQYILSRSNSNGSTHAAVTNGMVLGKFLSVGWAHATPGYLPAAEIRIEVDATGTVGATSMPGRMVLATTPDAGAAPVDAITINRSQVAAFANMPTLAGTGLVIDSIADADTTHAPSRNAVFDALAATQPLDATLTALAGQNWAANAVPIGSGADTVAQIAFAANTFPARASAGDLVAKSITDFGLSLVDDATAAAARTTLGIPTLDHGTYTPTVTGVANVDSVTAQQFQYLRVGNTVTVSGRIDVDATAAASTQTTVGISLPIASNFTASSNLAGAGGAGNVPYQTALIIADTVNDRANFVYYSTGTTSVACLLTFTYLVL